MNKSWLDFLTANGGIFEGNHIDRFAAKDEERAVAEKQTFICDLSHLDLLSVTGDDAESFLLGQLSNDLRQLDQNYSTQLTTYCNPKGRMLALFQAIKTPTGYLLQSDPEIGIAVMPRLKMYVMRSKVEISAEHDLVQIGIHGTRATELLQRHFETDMPDAAGSGVMAGDTIIIRYPVASPCFELIASSSDMQKIWEVLAQNCKAIGRHGWDRMRIRAGIPSLTPDTVESFIPQMLNLDVLNAINFKKGCYPGQEIIARMKYLGKLKQRMYLGHLDQASPPRAGAAVYARSFGDQSAGTVVAAELSPEGGVDLLVAAQISAATDDEFKLNRADNASIKLLPMPYTVPSTGETISK